MNPQPTFQTLPIDCLIEISSYLSLPECMFLRSFSRQLKAAVDEHFRTGVRTLPVVLSARYSPESVALYDEYCQQKFEYPYEHEGPYEKFAYGSTSGVSQLQMYDHKAEEYQVYFRPERYLVLFDLAKFGGFMDYISKYLPGITKLALIIDHEDHMKHVPELLNLYRKQLKALFLEETARSIMTNEYPSRVSETIPLRIIGRYRFFKLSPEFYHSIDELEALEELVFFPITINIDRYNEDGMLTLRHFLKRMLQKLKIMHFRDYTDWDEGFNAEYYRLAVFKNLEKLICNDYVMQIWRKASFPRLETLILGSDLIPDMESENIPSLRTIHFTTQLTVDNFDMQKINKFPKLERIYCPDLFLYEDSTVVNRSIKFIEFELFQRADGRVKYSEEKALKKLKKCLRCFQGLEKVIVREPFMELTGNDLLRILE